MDNKNFREKAHELVDWIADYYEEIRDYPVKPDVEPGEILASLPDEPPRNGEPFEQLFSDFKNSIVPGMTHWQHPRFMGYFPANTSYPSLLAEFLTAGLGAQCMSWLTSPAATELEEQVMEWLRRMIDLPDDMEGVIQDTASTSTLVALLMAREKVSDFDINENGYDSLESPLVIYTSEQTHSSIEKDAKIAGFGRRNVRKVGVDGNYAMDTNQLQSAIREDRHRGNTPCCVVATLGTTGSTAIDPLDNISRICKEEGLWLHVDAAFAGTALLLPEKRDMIQGIESVDSFVFNPHKWMFTNFDCSAFFVKDADHLRRVFSILPEYLKTGEDDKVKNYRDWGIQLGRRFRALKLWFVIRSFGVEGLRRRIRDHLEWTGEIRKKIESAPHFELLAPAPFNLLCFRLNPEVNNDFNANDLEEEEKRINRLNRELLKTIQEEGYAFLTHTTLDGKYTLRMVIGQTYVSRQDALDVWEYIRDKGKRLL